MAIDTGISVAIPAGTYGRIADKSGLAAKGRLSVAGGVIDADYRGPVVVLLRNLSDEPYEFAAGDKIAQMIFEKIEQPRIDVVSEFSRDRNKTVRGDSGFGSTGK